MNFLDQIHQKQVFARRTRVLGARIAAELPPDVSILDVGCGDGSMASRIQELRPDIRIQGIDTLVREDSEIAVEAFDGERIPYDGDSFDLVLLVDVLHHAEDPTALLRESARVARRWIVIKDHLEQGWLAAPTLRFMDRVGNSRHGVALPYHYWSPAAWEDTFLQLGLTTETRDESLGIYPWPLSCCFDRSLHFLARLTHSLAETSSSSRCE
jgi:SAM-dependent methyltransferase